MELQEIVVTGASGFIGSALIKELAARGHHVYALSRHPPQGENITPLVGDILKPNLGLDKTESLKDINMLYHLAGVHTLRLQDKDRSIWRTNVLGTRNVLDFCLNHDIPQLLFTSTAYTWPVNPYGMSKITNERDIGEFADKHGLKAVIYKPSIVLGTADNPYPGHFSRFVSALVRVHHRAELVRRKIEGALLLPPLEPLFRIRGNPQGRLNLVPIDAVAGLLTIPDTVAGYPQTVWLTNPHPPTLEELGEWVGEFIMVKIKFQQRFKATPIELMFEKLMTPFSPYLRGDDFPSDLPNCPPVTKELIQETVKRTILD